MLRIGGGEWRRYFALGHDGFALAQRVVAQYPQSQYAGWFAATGVARDPAVAAAALREWLGQAPSNEINEWRWLRLARFEEFAGRYRGPDADRDGYRKRAMAGRKILEGLLRSSRNPLVLVQAREQLADVADMEESLRQKP
jgi:uncharacterized protein YeaO (DUF488 family)